jgi:restriction system protein
MAVPDYQTLMSPLLRSIAKASPDASVGEVADAIADELGISSDDRSVLIPSGGQTLLMNRLHWAKSYLARAGALESTKRGRFRITKRGNDLLQQHPQHIDNTTLRQFPEFRGGPGL